MMSPLYQELHRWQVTPFVWGEMDCVLSIADWVEKVTGKDPAEALRGVYDSRGSCQRETGFLRNPIDTVERCLATIGGLPRVEKPAPGDIGIIMAHDAKGRLSPCGGLWLGEAWGFKTRNEDHGGKGAITIKPILIPKVLAIWGVGYEA